MTPEIIVALIGVLGVGVGTLLAGWFARRKASAEADVDNADANEKIRATVMMLIEPLRKRIEELECEVDLLKGENTDLRQWAEVLVAQIRGLGHQPTQPLPRRTPPPRGSSE